MRSLILGATGLVGGQLVVECERRNHVVTGTRYRRPHPDHTPLDLRDDEAVLDLIDEVRPDVVFLAAGISNPDYAEAFPDECDEVNAGGVAAAAKAAADAGAIVVYVSPAHVFGECPTARKEGAAVAPVSAHGRAAVAAEDAVRAATDRHLIVRTQFVFGPEEYPRNAAATAVRRMADGDTVRAAVDRLCQPTYAVDLAAAVVELVERGSFGTVHAVGPDRVTEFQFFQLVAFVNGFDSDLVEPAKAATLGEDAPRPLAPWLDRSHVRRQLGTRAFRSPADGLRHLRDAADVFVAARAA